MPEQAQSKPSILLVDDEQVLLRSLARWMRERFEVFQATSGEEGLALLAQRSFDVIISDQRMRGICGTDFLREVSVKWPNILRVLMTGHSDLEVASHALLEGHVSIYLKKPLFPEEIECSILDLLAKRKPGDAKQIGTLTIIDFATFCQQLTEHLVAQNTKKYEGALLLIESPNLAALEAALQTLAEAEELCAEHSEKTLVLFMPACSLAHAEARAKSLLSAMPNLSIGIASYPAWGVTHKDLLCAAQGALDVEAGRRVGNKRF